VDSGGEEAEKCDLALLPRPLDTCVRWYKTPVALEMHPGEDPVLERDLPDQGAGRTP
jgi:hypothetical protein